MNKLNNYHIGIMMLADRVGIAWDIDYDRINSYVMNEAKPESRFWFGSPCKFVRRLDLAVHVYFPSTIEEKYPELALYLRSTSPRWGQSWREW
tara:strand:- start:322 stop:600 length:279 start_codon:yes stop_codon:yes gene_type:complete